jgi:hypothetical protein
MIKMCKDCWPVIAGGTPIAVRPAEIRACGFPAHGSHLEWLTAKRASGHGFGSRWWRSSAVVTRSRSESSPTALPSLSFSHWPKFLPTIVAQRAAKSSATW